MNANEQATMVKAHASWARKQELERGIIALLRELAENVFYEYRDIRGCSTEAAYQEAKEAINRIGANGEDVAWSVLSQYRTGRERS